MDIETIEINAELVKKEQKELNIKPNHHVDIPFEKATFGMGCYWTAEALFGATSGVLRTRVGYTGGNEPFSNDNIADHTEAVEIDYDPLKITYENLLKLFWNNHEYDYTGKTKRKYMSIIIFHTSEQKSKAEISKNQKQIKRSPEVIRTEILQATKFYPSEDLQQKYRLQQHQDFASTLELNSTLLQSSFVATKLNGYLAGVADIEQFEREVDSLGLTPIQIDYVKYFVNKFEKIGLSCSN